MKTDFNNPDRGTLIPYRAPESETVVLGSQISICAGSQNGSIENWTFNPGGYNDEDFD